jgi:hypothetical protein
MSPRNIAVNRTRERVLRRSAGAGPRACQHFLNTQMQSISGLLVLVLSPGMVAVAIQGAVRGWLPNGPNGFKQGKGVSRQGNPIGFWFFFCLYISVGLYGAIYALRLLSGRGAA